MTAIKESSTIQENLKSVRLVCPITYVMERIGGYWKPVILCRLTRSDLRYSELRRAVPAITEKVLIQQLKQLEADGLVVREARPVVPPYVTYRLTAAGQDLVPLFEAMAVWAAKDSSRLREN